MRALPPKLWWPYCLLPMRRWNYTVHYYCQSYGVTTAYCKCLLSTVNYMVALLLAVTAMVELPSTVDAMMAILSILWCPRPAENGPNLHTAIILQLYAASAERERRRVETVPRSEADARV